MTDEAELILEALGDDKTRHKYRELKLEHEERQRQRQRKIWLEHYEQDIKIKQWTFTICIYVSVFFVVLGSCFYAGQSILEIPEILFTIVSYGLISVIPIFCCGMIMSTDF